jgi:hypothetical protein
VIAFSYITTARHLVESSRLLSEGTQNPQLNTRRNTARIVVGLTAVFVISYLPYHAFWTYYITTETERVYLRLDAYPNIFPDDPVTKLHHSNDQFQYIYLISTSFLSVNSCLNPVALFYTSSPFRQHLKRYLTCCCKTNPPPTDMELARRN